MYDYQCQKCGMIDEHFFSVSGKPETVPCLCGGTAHKILSASMVIGDDMPAWMRHPETLGTLKCAGDKTPITTRSEYNRFLKTRNIAEKSANREI
jgi:putative FmdB family regulatory protein